MLISSAFAHGSNAEAGSTSLGPFILLAIGAVFVLVLFAEKKWRRHKLEQIPSRLNQSATTNLRNINKIEHDT